MTFLLLVPNVSAQAPSPVFDLVVDGLDRPLDAAHAGDGSGRLFVVERTGLIRVLDAADDLQATPFLDLTGVVSCCEGEQGLLGMAFHPQFASNGYFFVSYTNASGDSVLARYTASPPSAASADPMSSTVLLMIAQPRINHNGGKVAFSPLDGYLYAAIGDGGGSGDPDENAQDTSNLLGAVLRLDVDGMAPYEAPASNPFVGVAGMRDEIWAYGLRNPWRFSFDRLNGDLFIGDVGQNTIEEIDYQPASSPGGENYGWDVMEGSQCFEPSVGCDPSGLTLPILEYGHDLGCSVTGGYIYRGTRYLGLQGHYLFADFCTGTLWTAFPNAAGVWAVTSTTSTGVNVAGFGEDEAGEIYLIDIGGGVYRVRDGASEAALFADSFESRNAANWRVVQY